MRNYAPYFVSAEDPVNLHKKMCDAQININSDIGIFKFGIFAYCNFTLAYSHITANSAFLETYTFRDCGFLCVRPHHPYSFLHAHWILENYFRPDTE